MQKPDKPSPRVLLTGASGFIGRHALADLAAQGIEVVPLGRTRPSVWQGEFLQGDLLDCAALPELVKRARATHLMHLAWNVEHGRLWTAPINLRWVEASLRLVEAFCASGGHAVTMAGTLSEYDDHAGYCREDATPLAPTSLYGIAKDATRRLAAAVCQAQGVTFSWGRIFFVYGAGEDRRRLIPALFDVFDGQRPPFGVNGHAWRDFIHVKDVASGLTRLLTGEAEGVYNIATGKPTAIADLVRLIAAACGADPQSVLALASERPGDPAMMVGDCTKLQALGWRPAHTLSELANRQEYPPPAN